MMLWIHMWINPLSFSLFQSLLFYFPHVFGTWIRRSSLQCVESVVRLSMSCVSVLSMPERCRSVKGRCSSARLVLFLVLLHYWWSASLSSYCMCLSFQPALMWRILSCLLAHSHIHTHSRQAEDSCALNDLRSMIFVSVIRLQAQFRSAKRHL